MARMPCLGCGRVSEGSRCPNCKAIYDANNPRQRGTSSQRGYDSAWQNIRKKILDRDNWICNYCGKKLFGADATVDHIVALSNGGARLEPDNLVSACLKCNSAKKDR